MHIEFFFLSSAGCFDKVLILLGEIICWSLEISQEITI